MRTKYLLLSPYNPCYLRLILSNYQGNIIIIILWDYQMRGFAKQLIELVDDCVVIAVLKGKIKGATYRYETIQLCN